MDNGPSVEDNHLRGSHDARYPERYLDQYCTTRPTIMPTISLLLLTLAIRTMSLLGQTPSLAQLKRSVSLEIGCFQGVLCVLPYFIFCTTLGCARALEICETGVYLDLGGDQSRTTDFDFSFPILVCVREKYSKGLDGRRGRICGICGGIIFRFNTATSFRSLAHGRAD